jgi:hypothetical protein
VFEGSIVPETGKSWCPDCVDAEPYIERYVHSRDDCVVVHCKIPREGYKGNPRHPYRVHPKIRLTAVPTLLKWGTQQRLVEGDILSKEKIDLLFEEE